MVESRFVSPVPKHFCFCVVFCAELTGGPACPECRPPPSSSVTDSHSPGQNSGDHSGTAFPREDKGVPRREPRDQQSRPASAAHSLFGLDVLSLERAVDRSRLPISAAHPSRSLLPSLAGASFASRGARGRRGSPLYQMYLGQSRRPDDACEPGPAGGLEGPPLPRARTRETTVEPMIRPHGSRSRSG